MTTCHLGSVIIYLNACEQHLAEFYSSVSFPLVVLVPEKTTMKWEQRLPNSYDYGRFFRLGQPGGEKRRNKRKYKQKKNTKKDITTTSFCEMWKYLYSNDRCPSLPPFSLLRHMFLRHAIFKITFVINENKCTLSIILLRSNPLPRYSPFFLILISRSQDYDLVLNTSTTRDYEYTIVNLASRIVLVRILFPSFRVKINQSAS